MVDGVGVAVGSTSVSSTVDNAMEETVSTSAEGTSDVASGAVAVLESSVIVVGDSDRLSDALRKRTTGFVYGSSTDATVNEQDGTGSVSNVLID